MKDQITQKYRNYEIDDNEAMDVLRDIFPAARADDLNFVLFSTSGIHGSYSTIEDVERGESEYLTFLIIHPRLVCMKYGNCKPESKEDFDFLKKLRKSSLEAISQIGAGV